MYLVICWRYIWFWSRQYDKELIEQYWSFTVFINATCHLFHRLWSWAGSQSVCIILVCCCGSPHCHSAGNIFENNSMQKNGHHSGERQASNTSLPLVLLAANERSFSVPLAVLVVLSAPCVQNTYQIKCQINSP